MPSVAGPLSPVPPGVPVPVIVVTVLVTKSIRRMAWFSVSTMKRFPDESMSSSFGPLNVALEAGPPSPEYPRFPFPAKRVILPVLRLIDRIALPSRSHIYTCPFGPTATARGPMRDAS